jgi:gamma-glutamylcyclotransferase (GGCT)/AIG2-like uncharacterized protein YtfP
MSIPCDLNCAAESAPAWQPCGASHVAVYGTLRAGGINDIARLRPGAACVGKARLTGTLHDLGWYPGLVLHGAQTVLAEVYAIDDALERALDGIEGLWPEDLGEYAKRLLTLPVELAGGGTQAMTVLVYEALPATVARAPVIAAGDWLAWAREQGRSVRHTGEAFALNAAQNRK